MGAAQAGYGMYTMGQAKQREEFLRTQGLPKMQTPQEYYDLYQNASRSRAFEQEKAMTDSIMASNLNTLAAGGSRALIGGAPAVTLQAQRGLAGAAERDFQRQQKALESLAAAEARTAGMNFQQESARYAADLAGAQASFQAGAETAVSGLDTALGAGTLAYQELNPKKVDDSPDPNSGGYFDIDGNEVSVKPGSEGDYFTYDPTKTTPTNGGSLLFRSQFSTLDNLGVNVPTIGQGARLGVTQNPSFPAYQFDYTRPGISRYRNVPGMGGGFAEGGSMTTPGKYTADHSLEYDVKTKDGKTIATLTGGETLVFNPQQRRFLKRIIGRLLKGQKVQLGKNETKTANETLKAFKK